MRSFSNLWFWIVLAVMWSTASHWVLGVPFDMVARARKSGGQIEEDLEDLVRINVNRLLYIARLSGLWLLGLVCFVLAQAVFLLAFPMSLVGALNLSTARLIERDQLTSEGLRRRLTRHRTYTQAIGMLAIFVTAMWGMYQNLSIGALGG